MNKTFSPALLLLGFLFCGGTALAHPADSTSKSKHDELIQVYHRAIQYNDMSTAAVALVTYLNAGGAIQYNDSLAVVYYNMNNLSGSYKLAGESYARDNKNIAALSLLADISGQTNDAKISLEWYEKLCPLNPMPYNYYQLATKQFSLERSLECKQSLAKVLADTVASIRQNVKLVIGQGYTETVPVLAAAYNMLGVIAMKENNAAQAKQYYQTAIKIFPDFVIVKQNMDAMKKPAVPGKKTK